MNYCHIPENVRDVINNSAEGTQQECFDAIAESKDWADAQMNLKNALDQLESECQRIRKVIG